MSVQAVDWLAIAPPLALALAAITVLVADAFLEHTRLPIAGGLSLVGLLVAGEITVALASKPRAV